MLLGQVSDEDKVRVLHSVDVFCSPNTGGESFGIVTAEAMAAGAPIVASDIDAFRQVLRGGEAGELFAIGDAGRPGPRGSAAARRPGPAGRAVRRGAGRGAPTTTGRWWPADVLSVYETVVLGRTAVGRHRVAAVSLVMIADIVRSSSSAALFIGVYVSWRAGRLDRLHARVDTARAALDATLLRRSSVGPGAGHLRAARPGHQPAAGRARRSGTRGQHRHRPAPRPGRERPDPGAAGRLQPARASGPR